MRSQFYWALLSSLAACIAMVIIRVIRSGPYGPSDKDAICNEIGFGMLLFVCIYFVVGVIMLFNKKSESFAKGLLLSALILFILMIIFLIPGYIESSRPN